MPGQNQPGRGHGHGSPNYHWNQGQPGSIPTLDISQNKFDGEMEVFKG